MTKQNKLCEFIIIAIFSFTIVVALLNFISIEVQIYDIRLYILLIMMMTLIYKPQRTAIFRLTFYSLLKLLLTIKNLPNKKEWMLIEETEDFHQLVGLEFEYCLKELFEKYGFVVAITKDLGDDYTDLILWKGTRKYIVYTNRSSVAVRTVQKAATKIYKFGANGVFIVTDQNFTNSAVKLAQMYNIKLVDQKILMNMISAQNKHLIFHSDLSFITNR